MQLHFTKMEGIGNDYIYFDGISQEIPMDKEFITKISDRHFGIGSDGMIVVLPSDKYDFKMRMFNRDGSEAMMCGNGIRCFAKFIYDVRCCIVHNKEAEFHILYNNYEEYESIIPLMNEINRQMVDKIFNIINTINSDIHYTTPSLELY